MREFDDPHDRDGADASAEARGEPASDSSPPRRQPAHDAAARLAYALEYLQQVKEVYAAHDATSPEQSDARGEQHPSTQADGLREQAGQPTREADPSTNARDVPAAQEILPNMRLTENIDRLLNEYQVNAQGKFGVKGSGRSQRIYHANPEAVARKFYETLGAGGDLRPIPGKGYVRWFDDGSHIAYRPASSSDGTPAVEITVSGRGSKLAAYQKIHFMKGPAR